MWESWWWWTSKQSSDEANLVLLCFGSKQKKKKKNSFYSRLLFSPSPPSFSLSLFFSTFFIFVKLFFHHLPLLFICVCVCTFILVLLLFRKQKQRFQKSTAITHKQTTNILDLFIFRDLALCVCVSSPELASTTYLKCTRMCVVKTIMTIWILTKSFLSTGACFCTMWVYTQERCESHECLFI